jgi:hypothetical protein
MKRNSPKLPKSEVSRLRDMVPTVDELRIIDLMRDYRAIRNRYFGSSIPPVEDVMLRFIPRKELSRLVRSEEDDIDAVCSFGMHHGIPSLKAIALADDLNVEETRLRILHEMAHMKVNLKFGRMMGEGKHWKKEMRRLMAAGAFDGWL